jgi:hypothetical protein
MIHWTRQRVKGKRHTRPLIAHDSQHWWQLTLSTMDGHWCYFCSPKADQLVFHRDLAKQFSSEGGHVGRTKVNHA